MPSAGHGVVKIVGVDDLWSPALDGGRGVKA